MEAVEPEAVAAVGEHEARLCHGRERRDDAARRDAKENHDLHAGWPLQ